ncbi:FERM domain-containing protein 6-like isoform X2 [Kryptolebias marmoratus]|uniref:FERM domain-containing protein 6-like isoform X2 n=1 Tax=Kryptolebias marmoratus TaxID=37003 RepID=UPI0018ACD5F4|nr:FERM domain-containing protein 6-like isoform X2 [Kryptolebias marmoratus]
MRMPWSIKLNSSCAWKRRYVPSHATLRDLYVLRMTLSYYHLEHELNFSKIRVTDIFLLAKLIKRRGRDYLLRHAPKLHSELRGLSWSQAVLQFIKESSRLQDGAVTFYRMRQDKKEKKSSILLGVARTGVHVYQEVEGKHCAMFDFAWTDIDHLTFQGSRFEIAAVGSLSLPKLAYYTHSAFHSEHVLRHLRGSHRFHISTRDAAGCVQQLEDSQAPQFHKEAYICDMTGLRQRLSCSFLTSSMSDCSAAVETGWAKEEEEEGSSSCLLKGENISFNEAELWDETEEVFVDDPAEVSWLAELLHGVSVDGPLVLPSSCWAAVTVEMKQVSKKHLLLFEDSILP